MLLSVFALSWCLLVALVRGKSGETGRPLCKATPESPDWPAPEKWQWLNDTVSGRLIKTVPPGAVCHQSQPAYNANQCLSTQLWWANEYFHSSDPVSVEWNNWTNDTCLPDPTFTCSSVGYPVYVINATSPDHVKAGVNFARENNIRLVVKNSGHDYLGRSTAPYSLSIWVHHMKGIRVHDKAFSPKNCGLEIKGTAITAAAGTEMLEAYHATAAFNHTLVGGNGRTVALGGFITGGGHSILSPKHGLAVDHVLEMEMVDANGDLLTLNECENEDLFYASRGGGGSTFGVLTSITIGTIPSPRVMGMRFSMTADSTNPNAFDMVAYFLGQTPRLINAGVSGYPVIHKAMPSPLVSDNRTISGIIGNVIMLDTDDPGDITKLFEPIFSHINATWPGFTFSANTTFYPSFYHWYLENFDPTPAGYSTIATSRLLDEEALSKNATATKIAFEKFAGSGLAGAYMVSGKGVWRGSFRGPRTAVCPSWRSAYVHAATSASFPPHDPGAAAEAWTEAKRWSGALRELSPSSGAYMNEASTPVLSLTPPSRQGNAACGRKSKLQVDQMSATNTVRALMRAGCNTTPGASRRARLAMGVLGDVLPQSPPDKASS